MIRTLSMVVCACGLSMSAAGQNALFQDWEHAVEADVIFVASPGRSDAGALESEPVLGELAAAFKLERVLDNGAEIGTRLGIKAQADHPARAGFSGRVGPGLSEDGLSLRGAFTGLTAGGELEDDQFRVSLETAFVYIDGGYGELVAGRDVGIARRFHVGAPTVFRRHRAINPALDTSGIATVLTRNDLTGPSAKVSYATPRLLGLRLGASYTPRANVSGIDRDPDRLVAGIDEPELEDALEAGFSFSRRFRASGVRVQSHGSYGRASVDSQVTGLDRGTVEVWSTGGSLAWKQIEVGADWLTTDNAGGRYRAWSTGVRIERFGFVGSALFGRSFDALTGFDGQTWQIGIAKPLFDRFTVSLGLEEQVLKTSNESNASSLGPVIEITLRL
ncbi:MAG: porin [Pseudomonadota bacterium]